MTPEQIAASYNEIAPRWLDLGDPGFAQIERAIAFAKNREKALDVGCGVGRCFSLLAKHGFQIDGVDVSPEMIAMARQHHPQTRLFLEDICQWDLPNHYDLIVAWDSTWHAPLDQQQRVLEKLIRGLAPGGVLIFTTGGLDAESEKTDSSMGPPMYYSVLGISRTLQVISESNSICRHLEYDQYPEPHVYIIVQNMSES